MPSSKRRSSGGAVTPSKPPAKTLSVPEGEGIGTQYPGQDHGLQTPSRDFKRYINSENTFNRSGACDGGLQATVIAVDDRDVKGKAFLWMSEAAMVAAPLSTGSLILVSVISLGGSNRTSPGTHMSLPEIQTSHHEVEVSHSAATGRNVAVAVVWPSQKLEGNNVRLSRVLASTLGPLPTGSTIGLRVLKMQSLKDSPTQTSAKIDSYKGCTNSILHDCVSVSLQWCPPPEAVLATGSVPVTQNSPRFTEGGLSIVSPSPETSTNYHHDLQSASGRGRAVLVSHGGSSHISGNPTCIGLPLVGYRFGGGNEYYKGSKFPTLIKWSSVWASFEKGKDKVKNLLEQFAARWIAGRYLLLGNLVHVPLYGCDCNFLVTAVTTSAQTMCNKSNPPVSRIECTSSWSDQGETTELKRNPHTTPDEPLRVYLLDHNTVVTLLPPTLQHETGAQAGQTDLCSPASGAVEEHRSEGPEVELDRLEYSSLGGLSMQIEKLRQHLEMSLFHLQHLKRYGLQPVRGVLLHGPPGTGKSSLARAAACDAGVKLFAINGPEIVSEFYGESEASLRTVFATATKSAPSVVFIDELDALVPARKDGSEELGQRMVATLLTLMDGGTMETLEGVLVIAATNRIDSIDPALRRPGRFDVEIEIGVPSPVDRLGILQVLLKDMKHVLNPSDISDLVATTHGFVGADLAALCNEAAMSALRRSVQFHESRLSVDVLAENFADFLISSDASRFTMQPGQAFSLTITLEDFQVAKTKVRPSAMREVALEVPRVRWSDIGGQDDVKQKLREIVEWPQKQSDAIARMGVDPPHGVLLHGPPGCSKTLMARAVASETGLNFIAVKGPELFSKWVGESEKAVQTLFARARAAAPSVVFFDEIDGLAIKRECGQGDGVSVGDRVMSQLLIEMDGLVPMKGVSVIAATNRLDIIDDALLRPGRFDRVLYVGPPDEVAREKIFGIHLQHMPCGPDVSHGTLAAHSQNYTGADISAVCQEAAMAALAEDINAKVIKMCHFRTALDIVHPSDIWSR